LILNGEAKITTHPNDILSEYNISVSSEKSEQKAKPIFKDKIDEKIYDLLLFESLTIDDMITKS
jgi:predicted Rossmann fold nucleotide-binding protein DprA/Smf involved in DNA uptake